MNVIETASRPSATPPHREVSALLIIGIFVMPYIFAWFLLREGYSKRSRLIGLGWMAIVLLVLGLGLANPGVPGDGGAVAGQAAKPTFDVDPNRADKDRAAYLAKQVVPSALKDPSSADFGTVWGMSASVACGYVNAKNSFGALAGKTRFILDDDRVAFENGQAGFARRWNSTCISKPTGPAPSGAGGMRWGSQPTAALKQFAPATEDGLAVYVPRGAPKPLEGLAVTQAVYTFDRSHLFSADFIIAGAAGRNALLTTYVKKYGTPQTYNESMGIYTWSWPSKSVSVVVIPSLGDHDPWAHFRIPMDMMRHG